MRSINQYITRRLVIGQAIVWLIAAGAVWWSQYARLNAEFDNELTSISSSLRYRILSIDLDTEIENRWPQFLDPNSGWFFESWYEDGSHLLRSASLGARRMTRPTPPEGESDAPPARGFPYWLENQQGADGQRARSYVAEFPIRPLPLRRVGLKDQGGILIVTRSRSELDRTLIAMGIAILVVGVGASWASARLARHAVDHGLIALVNMGNQANSIHVTSLDKRFEEEDIPIELQPISRRLNQLMSRIEAGFERERRFSSDLAHEMRTPLAALRCTMELMQKWQEENVPERQEQCIDMVRQMEGIVSSLLDLARWESGERELDREPLDLSTLVEKVWEGHPEETAQKDLSLVNKIPKDAKICADLALLTSIVSNLVSNAVSYSPEKSEITVSYEVRDQFHLSVENQVLDEFDSANIDRMADRFWREDPSRSGSRHAGLGLAIVDACIDRHGWALDICHDPDRATLKVSVIGTTSEEKS